MKVLVIDGKGGKMGCAVIDMLKKHYDFEIYAIGTNVIATQQMMRAGADYGATGENPVVFNSSDSDIIIAPIGCVIANSFIGEVTPKMAVAVGESKAVKLLLPVNKCHNIIVGIAPLSMNELIEEVHVKIDEVLKLKS